MDALRSLPSSSASSRQTTPVVTTEKSTAPLPAGSAKARDAEEDGKAVERTVAAPPAPPSDALDLLAFAATALASTAYPNPATSTTMLPQGMLPLDDLLREPVEFVPYAGGSQTSEMEGKYTPINSPGSNDSDSTVVSATSVSSISSTSTRVDTNASNAQPQSIKATTSKTASTINERPLQMTWTKAMPSPAGMKNPDTTCFINSTLQALLWSPPFVQGLLAEPSYDTCPHNVPPTRGTRGKSGFCCLCAMTRIAKHYHNPARPRDCYELQKEVDKLVDNVMQIMPLEPDTDQQDAHEFFMFLRAKMQAACASLLPSQPPVAKGETPPPKPPTFIDRAFEFKTRQRIKCNRCGYCSDTFTPEQDLGLDVRGYNDIRDAMRELSAVEILKGSNAYKCEKCNTLVTAEKSWSMMAAPPVLTLYLKRFGAGARSKLQHFMQYPQSLDLRPYLARDCPTQESTRYKLYAAVCHIGNSRAEGHYTATVKAFTTHPNGQKGYVSVLVNDQIITNNWPIHEPKCAYMLFYLRDDSPVQPPQKLPQKPFGKQQSKARQPMSEAGKLQQKEGAAYATNKNGKRALVSDDDGDDDDGRDGSPKRPRSDGPERPMGPPRPKPVKVVPRTEKIEAPLQSPQSPRRATGEDSASKWRKATMEPVVGMSPDEKNVNGKRISDDEDAGSPVKRPRRDSIISSPVISPTIPKDPIPPLSPTVPTMGIIGLPARPAPASPVDASTKFKPANAGLPAKPNVLAAAPPNPGSSSAKKRKVDEAFDRVRPETPVATARTIPSSPLTPLPANTHAQHSTAKSAIETPPRAVADEDYELQEEELERQAKKAKKDKYKTTYGGKSSYGGKNPFSSAVGGGFGGGKRRLLM